MGHIIHDGCLTTGAHLGINGYCERPVKFARLGGLKEKRSQVIVLAPAVGIAVLLSLENILIAAGSHFDSVDMHKQGRNIPLQNCNRLTIFIFRIFTP